MKPSQIHALPTIHSESLHDSPFEPDLCFDVFGVEIMHLDPSFNDIKVDVKAEHQRDRIDTVVRSLVVEGKPFAIHIQAGHEACKSSVFVTDAGVFGHALTLVRDKIRRDDARALHDATDDKPIDLRQALDGAALANFGDEVRLMDGFLVAESGQPLVDPAAWRERCRDEVIPGIKAIGSEASFRDESVRELAIPAFRAAQRPDLEYLDVFDFEGAGSNAHWVAYVVVTEEGSYKVGVAAHMIDSTNWPWVHDLGGQRLGGPELADRYRGETFGYR